MAMRYPRLYQVNTRVLLTDLSRQIGRPVTLDDIPDLMLDRLVGAGFDWVWMLSVWQTGPAAKQVSRSNPEWRREFAETLPDLREEDIGGSGFAIAEYRVAEQLGGQAGLARLRDRLGRRGLKLMLDFVPNHMGLGHPWVESHTERFVEGTEADLIREPRNYTRVRRRGWDRILAYGRDPYFAGWPDTLQLDYSNPSTQDAMIGELQTIASQCDGVRCDMAMLLLPDVFQRTWGRRPEPFWPRATAEVRERHPGFCFMAEVYWDLEWTLQQQGFDYTYDKRLYDRLRDRHARPVREHFLAGLDYQDKLARFLENHDEPRAAATFPREVHEAAAIITFLSPGLRFFHQGQFEGRRKRISPHLVRGPAEPTDVAILKFYERLLAVLRQPAVHGAWRLLECVSAWEGNWTWDGFLAFAWQGPDRDGKDGEAVEDVEPGEAGDGGKRLLVAVNYSGSQAQCYVRLPFADLSGRAVRFADLMSPATYDRRGDDVLAHGLYLDLPPWGYHVFDVL